MAKPLKFKDFLTVDYTPGMPDEVSKNAKKRKMDTPTGNTGEAVETEALTTTQRLKRGRQMKRFHKRIEIGQQRAKRRTASLAVVKRRAQKQARNMVAKRMAKGVDKSDLTPQRKREIEQRMDRPQVKARIDRLVKKLMPRIRRAEIDRKRGGSGKIDRPAIG